MRGLKELRVKESDRLAATAAMLRGTASSRSTATTSSYTAGRAPGGGLVATHMDHRIAMSAVVMGLASAAPVGVDAPPSSPPASPPSCRCCEKLGAELS